jgi:hypothetical protein
MSYDAFKIFYRGEMFLIYMKIITENGSSFINRIPERHLTYDKKKARKPGGFLAHKARYSDEIKSISSTTVHPAV